MGSIDPEFLPKACSAEKYWMDTLGGCESTPYPSLPSFIEQPAATDVVEYQFSKSLRHSTNKSIPTLLHAAWALVMGRMTDSNDIVFGTTAPRGALPIRIQLEYDQRVETYLKAVQQQAKDIALFDTMGLNDITNVSSDCQKACLFQTVLVIQQNHGSPMPRFENYGLTIQIQVRYEQIYALASLDPRVLEPQLAFKLLRRLDFVAQQLGDANSELTLDGIDVVPPTEMDLIREWNSHVPPVIEKCIHEVINNHVLAEPDAQAVNAWDGELTYRELEKLALDLACHLVETGISPEKVVPLCFEKSMWTVVAMLAVLKAGGAFILLDPGLPSSRIQSICRQVHAAVSITSVSCESRLAPYTRQNIVLCQNQAESLKSKSQAHVSLNSNVTPRNAAYIIFTSGSTGEPKGCVVEHQSYCSAAVGHGKVLGMDSSTRALQFGSYNFAGAIMEIIMTLMYGGCVCVPSEEDRTANLTQTIGKLNANWAFLTSTVLAGIRPEDTPSLRTVCVGGEPIRSSQIREWALKAHLRQTYGSAETAAVVASASLSASSAVTSIGKPTTAKCWLVHPADVNQLVPIGAPGEVIFEGPVIGREYVGNPEKSSQAFISAPAWRAAIGTPAVSSRFYKTGDIAAYRSDGSIELLGRKDTQVKLRGQRIELGEIEHQARISSSDLKEVAVELTVLSNKGPALICLLVMKHTDGNTALEDETGDENSRRVVRAVRNRLAGVLPHYMVPSVFLPVPALPLTASGKTDRRRLRQLGSALSAERLDDLRSQCEESQAQPATDAELQMQEIWSRALKIEQKSIGLHSSFFQLGGNSFTAMKIVSEARKCGLHMIVADVFQRDTIAGLTRQLSLETRPAPKQYKGASLIDDALRASLLKDIDSEDIPVNSKDVEDIFPLTGVQEILVASSIAAKELADYFFIDLSDKVDLSDLETGCKRTLQRFPILRAAWLLLQERLWQVVMHRHKEPFRTIKVSGDIEESCRRVCLEDRKDLQANQPTASWILLKHETHGLRLVLRMAHAQYDAISAPLIFQSVFDTVKTQELPAQPTFDVFLSYAAEQRSRSIQHWSQTLKGSQLTPAIPHFLPPANTSTSEPEVVKVEAEAHLPLRPKQITAATLVRTAWAVLLSRVTGDSDVTFGQVIAGRNAAIPQIEEVVGCCLNIVPERVNLSSHTTVAEMLRASQEQLLMMGHADTLGWKDIIQQCTDWPAEAYFDSVHHHRDIDGQPEIQTPEGVTHMRGLDAHLMAPFFFLVSSSKGDNIKIELCANTHLITHEKAQIVIESLKRIIERLNSSMHSSVSSFMEELGPVV